MSVVPLLRQKMHLRRLRQKASDQRGAAQARKGRPTTATPPLSAGHPLMLTCIRHRRGLGTPQT